jgi:hypothetical protein
MAAMFVASAATLVTSAAIAVVIITVVPGPSATSRQNRQAGSQKWNDLFHAIPPWNVEFAAT